MLLHSINKWPHASSVHLWPYALFHCNDIHNHLPLKPNSNTLSFEIFTNSSIQSKSKNNHAFGCLAFTLDLVLQHNKSLPKWNSRCRLGLYLGNTPRHARSMSLVFHLTTDRVSPQFYIAHNDFFETVE